MKPAPTKKELMREKNPAPPLDDELVAVESDLWTIDADGMALLGGLKLDSIFIRREARRIEGYCRRTVADDD